MENAVQKLQKEISEKKEQILEIQRECSHPKACLSKTPRAQTGNYDQEDVYWHSCHCGLCDKMWNDYES